MESRVKKDNVYIPPQATTNYDEIEIPDEDILSKEDRELMDLHEILFEVDPKNCPMISQLEAWKGYHKSLYVSKISNESNEYYVWRTLKRNEFKQLSANGTFSDEEKANEILVEKCVLYPQVTQAWRLTSDAGVITTLGKQIAYKSGFVSPQEALSLIKVV